MAIRKSRPTSPGRRFATFQLRDDLAVERPHKPLTEGKSKSGGRNARGRITSRHRGGGAKRRYRQIDFKRLKDGVPAKVATIEYDPNRTCYIALLHYADGEKRYILAPPGRGEGPAPTAPPPWPRSRPPTTKTKTWAGPAVPATRGAAHRRAAWR